MTTTLKLGAIEFRGEADSDGKSMRVVIRGAIDTDVHFMTVDEWQSLVTIAAEQAKVSINAEIFEEGFWHPCSGCHESNEGYPTGPYSETFRCNLGGGCHECGGIGAVWEQFGDEHRTADCEEVPDGR